MVNIDNGLYIGFAPDARSFRPGSIQEFPIEMGLVARFFLQ
jgi:hypothetical protein